MTREILVAVMMSQVVLPILKAIVLPSLQALTQVLDHLRYHNVGTSGHPSDHHPTNIAIAPPGPAAGRYEKTIYIAVGIGIWPKLGLRNLSLVDFGLFSVHSHLSPKFPGGDSGGQITESPISDLSL